MPIEIEQEVPPADPLKILSFDHMSETQFGDSLDINPVDDDRLGPAKRPKKRRLAILIGAAIALCLLAGGGYFAVAKGWVFSHKNEKTTQSDALKPGETTLLAIPSVISSLDNGDGRPVYVKMTTKVEIAGTETEASLRRYIPEIQDIFQTYLHETRPQEIRGNGIYRLRETLLRRLRIQIAPLKITNFYITEFLIQ
ncbi:flagellar basal body-associated FliL family protein [Asaia sp. BMEF1]|uniref:flagellar basal body-associated FliL family protein n=1 Tax=Asaia sp. BMEF1 TaxID=3155932 RepID=UPI003F673F2E